MKSSWQDQHSLLDVSDQILKWTQNFYDTLDERSPANVDGEPPCLGELPETGIGLKSTLQVFEEKISTGLSGSVGPRFLGFVTGGSTPAAVAGDWLVSVADQNVMVPGDSTSSAIETQVIDWLRTLFDLPMNFTGTLTTGATTANILGALCGRQYAGEQQGRDIAAEGLAGGSVQIFSACPHASMLKALSVTGLGRNSVTPVPRLNDAEAMSVPNLDAALCSSRASGKIVVASAGTVTGTDFDALDEIARLCREHNAWLHVDAAFGLFTRLLPEHRHLTAGIEKADSITCDAHKWLNVPYDCGIFFTRHLKYLQQSCSVAAPYLEVGDSSTSYMDRGLENSRRFRALPVWMTLQAYGKEGYQALIEENCHLARSLGNWIEASAEYELLKPVNLNVVLFRPKTEVLDAQEALNRINRSRKVFMTPGTWNGEPAIRAAFSNWRTTCHDLEIAIDTLNSICSE